MPIHVTVRDGRIGRDRFLSDEHGGEVLVEFDVEQPYGEEHIGQQLELPDGSSWKIIGCSEHLNDQGWHQTLFIGD